MFEKRIATETSNTVERLTAAGMVPLGKLHMVEFAFGGWGTNPLMGAPWNPWDIETHRVAGGSSSGTGVAVAARLTARRHRQRHRAVGAHPVGAERLVGLKVTFGRIGLSGTMLLSWSLDSIGPMARCVEDCALMLNALAAPDARDPTTFGQPLEDFMQAIRPGSIEACGSCCRYAPASRLHASRRDQGLAVGAPHLREPGRHRRGGAAARLVLRPLPAAGTIIASEAYALHRDYIEDTAKAIGPGVRSRAMAARHLLPGAYPEEMRVLQERRRSFNDWFRAYDAILLPTMAIPAIPLAEVDETSPIPGYLTRPANYLGLCSLAMPPGLSGGLPVGVQIVGKPFAERDVLRLGKAFQGRHGVPSPRARPVGTGALDSCRTASSGPRASCALMESERAGSSRSARA